MQPMNWTEQSEGSSWRKPIHDTSQIIVNGRCSLWYGL